MQAQGNCGRGGICYVGAEDVLKGVLASERYERTEPSDEDEDDTEAADPGTCEEHGVQLDRKGECPTCTFIYGLDRR